MKSQAAHQRCAVVRHVQESIGKPEIRPPVLTVLSCPVLFFSGTLPGQTVGPIFTVYGSNDVFPRKKVPFGIRTTDDVICGKYIPKTP